MVYIIGAWGTASALPHPILSSCSSFDMWSIRHTQSLCSHIRPHENNIHCSQIEIYECSDLSNPIRVFLIFVLADGVWNTSREALSVIFQINLIWWQREVDSSSLRVLAPDCRPQARAAAAAAAAYRQHSRRLPCLPSTQSAPSLPHLSPKNTLPDSSPIAPTNNQ